MPNHCLSDRPSEKEHLKEHMNDHWAYCWTPSPRASGLEDHRSHPACSSFKAYNQFRRKNVRNLDADSNYIKIIIYIQIMDRVHWTAKINTMQIDDQKLFKRFWVLERMPRLESAHGSLESGHTTDTSLRSYASRLAGESRFRDVPTGEL